MPNAHAQNIYPRLMIKAYVHQIFHDISHKPFKNKPYVYYTIKTQYAARSHNAASLGRCCQFVKIKPVIHNPLHIHRFLADEWNS